jgi:hypothetical protein
MANVAWKRFSVAATLVLVTFLAAGSASLVFAPNNPPWQAFVAADLTLPSPGPANFPLELFVILQARGPANHMVGGLYVFSPVSSCTVNVPLVVVVSGNLFTDSNTGAQILNFTGFTPPDPCIRLAAGLVNIVIGPPPPPSFEPPDPCVLTFHTHTSTITFTGETDRLIVTTGTTTTTSTTPS